MTSRAVPVSERRVYVTVPPVAENVLCVDDLVNVFVPVTLNVHPTSETHTQSDAATTVHIFISPFVTYAWVEGGVGWYGGRQ